MAAGPGANTPMDAGCSSGLPLELWLRIFECTPGAPHLWTKGRQVCKVWNDWIPRIFAQRYLEGHRMSIIYDIGAYDVLGILSKPEIFLSFDRYDSETVTRCVLRQIPELPPELDGPALSDGWHGLYEEYQTGDDRRARELLEFPPHVMVLDGLTNDTELSQATLDIDKREISFNWYATLHDFFREAAEQDRRGRKWVDDLGLASFMRMPHGLKSHPAVASGYLAALYNAHVMVRKQVRRERIARSAGQCSRSHLDQEDSAWEERQALQRMADLEPDEALLGPFGDAVRVRRTALGAKVKTNTLSAT